jgi:hypothetical protein
MPKSQPSKPPILRPKSGHKRPCYKPNNDEVERRITAVELLLSRGARRTEIHQQMEKQFGVHWRTADRYLARAREALMKRLNKSKDEHRCESLAFYESVMRSGEAKASEKLMACKRKDELLGLDAPRRTEVSGPDGGKIELEDKSTRPIDYAKLGAVARAVFGLPATNGDGEPVHSPDAGTEAGVVPGHNGS